MNHVVFGKIMKYVKTHKDIKLVTTDKKMSRLVSKPDYHRKNGFHKNYQQQKQK